MSGSSDGDDHVWPGFVDVLTSMTKVLVFVMMLLAITISNLLQNISRDLLDRIAEAAEIDIDTRADVPLNQITDEIIAKLEQAKRRPPSEVQAPPEEKKLVAELAPTTTTPATAVTVQSSPSQLTITYMPRMMTLDDAAKAELVGFSERQKAATGAIEIRAAAGAGNGSLSEARRVAYYRGMIVRGELVAGGVAPDRIKVRVEEIMASDAGTEVVRVFVSP